MTTFLAPVRRWPRVPATALLGLVLAACSTAGGASFDPNGPCTTDGQRAGAYPQLESVLPSAFDEVPPVRRDSGRNCTDGALGSLAEHGIEEVRFAGAQWETGRRSGVTVAVFTAPGLTAERLIEFYRTGAEGARKASGIDERSIKVDGVKGRRLDVLNDESFQSIIVFDDDAPDTVRAVLIASDVREIQTKQAHDEVVRRAAATALAP